MKLEENKIYEMDCLEGLSKIEDKSIDLIVIDPPYNIGKDIWDKISEYETWMFSVFKECERVLKPTGSFYWFHNDFEVISEFQHFLRNETAFIFRNLLIWNKKFDGCNSEAYLDIAIATNKNRTYRKFAEYYLLYTFEDFANLNYSHISEDVFRPFREYIGKALENKNVSWKSLEIINTLLSNGVGKSFSVARQISQNKLNSNYNQLKIMTKKEYSLLQPIINFDMSYEEMKTWWDSLNDKFKQERKAYKKETLSELNAIRYTFNKTKNHSVTNYQTPKDKLHPTQKPIELLVDIIETSSNEGDIVLDCFAGSGTTAIAAKKKKRRFICFEKEKKYVEIANKELSKIP